MPSKIINQKNIVDNTNNANELQGASQLLVDAVGGITDIVEALHRQITGVAPIVGAAKAGHTKGITGLVYRSVRGITDVVGLGLNEAFARLGPVLGSVEPSESRMVALAAINGVFGDYLSATNNALAIPMTLRCQKRTLVLQRKALAADFKNNNGKLVVLVHGLCMNDLQWHREGHDHGASLQQEFGKSGYTPLYLRYNSGRQIAENGEEFAQLLERLIAQWPVPVTELIIIGHSMGGLVSRSACGVAAREHHAWLRSLKKMIFLGTPHHGAPLERAGNWLDILLGVSPYSAPFSRLGTVRSAGIKDLRHGRIDHGDHALPLPLQLPLPKSIKTYVIAATKQAAVGKGTRLPGDGLVPVNSALGIHKNAELTLPIPASRQAVFYGLDHFDLLSSGEVYQQIKRWLTQS